MLFQLNQLQRGIGWQVGILTPHICRRWVCDILSGAVCTIGGPGLSLVDLIELGVGDGKVVKEHFVFRICLNCWCLNRFVPRWGGSVICRGW